MDGDRALKVRVDKVSLCVLLWHTKVCFINFILTRLQSNNKVKIILNQFIHLCLFFRCVVGPDSRASCNCDPGYSGERCEGCESDNVCFNGGTCDTTNAVCMCPAGKFRTLLKYFFWGFKYGCVYF